MSRNRLCTAKHAALLLGCTAGICTGQSAPLIREVATSGQAAPGLPNIGFDAVGSPRLNAAGKVLFWARLRGPSVLQSDEDTLWTDRDGFLELIVRGGDPSTTGFGDYITGFPGAAMNDVGFIALVTSFMPAGLSGQITRLAAYSEASGGDFLLRKIESVTSYNLPSLIPLRADGGSLFREDTSKNNNILSLSAVQPILDPATPVPGAGAGGVPAGATFRQFSDPDLNMAGRFVLRAAVGTGTLTAAWTYAHFTDRAGTPQRLATVGEPIPGGPPDRLFAELAADPQIDDAGRIVYWARFTDPAAPEAPNTAVFLDSPVAGASAIATAGHPAPGAEPAIFSTFSRSVSLGAGGRAAFLAFLSGDGVTPTNNSGLWIADPNQPARLLVREGEIVPDSPGALFSAMGNPHVGPNGQIVFAASLRGPDVDQNSAHALFATDGRGSPKMLARVGRGFPLGQDSQRIVRRIGFDDGGPGLSQMNAVGEIAFTLWFTDGGSAVFVAALPCPADFNRDGGVDGGDVESFFLAWEAADSNADVNEDGGIDGGDVEAFFILWESGGC